MDVLATFAGDAHGTLFDGVCMRDELAALLGRPVDPVNRRAIERSRNWIRRAGILDSAEPWYVASDLPSLIAAVEPLVPARGSQQ